MALLDQGLEVLLALTVLKGFAVTFLWPQMITDWVTWDKRLDHSRFCAQSQSPGVSVSCSCRRLQGNPPASSCS